MDRPIYIPPQPFIYTRDTVIQLGGCSGFMIENLGTTEFTAGEPGSEIIPFELKNSREFECPEGGVYEGTYSIKFTGGTGRVLIILNRPISVPDSSGSDEEVAMEGKYHESLVQ